MQVIQKPQLGFKII